MKLLQRDRLERVDTQFLLFVQEKLPFGQGPRKDEWISAQAAYLGLVLAVYDVLMPYEYIQRQKKSVQNCIERGIINTRTGKL
jgi:hypothetical protein